ATALGGHPAGAAGARYNAAIVRESAAMAIRLLAALIDLGLLHVAPQLAGWRRDGLFRRWVAQLSDTSGAGRVVLALLPPLVICALLAWLFAHTLLGELPRLLFALVVLLYCFGPREFERDLEAILAAPDGVSRDAAPLRRAAVVLPARSGRRVAVSAGADVESRRFAGARRRQPAARRLPCQRAGLVAGAVAHLHPGGGRSLGCGDRRLAPLAHPGHTDQLVRARPGFSRRRRAGRRADRHRGRRWLRRRAQRSAGRTASTAQRPAACLAGLAQRGGAAGDRQLGQLKPEIRPDPRAVRARVFPASWRWLAAAAPAHRPPARSERGSGAAGACDQGGNRAGSTRCPTSRATPSAAPAPGDVPGSSPRRAGTWRCRHRRSGRLRGRCTPARHPPARRRSRRRLPAAPRDLPCSRRWESPWRCGTRSSAAAC